MTMSDAIFVIIGLRIRRTLLLVIIVSLGFQNAYAEEQNESGRTYTDVQIGMTPFLSAFGLQYGLGASEAIALEGSLLIYQEPVDELSSRPTGKNIPIVLATAGIRNSWWKGPLRSHEFFVQGGVGFGDVSGSFLFAARLGLGYGYHFKNGISMGPSFVSHYNDDHFLGNFLFTLSFDCIERIGDCTQK